MGITLSGFKTLFKKKILAVLHDLQNLSSPTRDFKRQVLSTGLQRILKTLELQDFM